MAANPPYVSEIGTLMVLGTYTALGEPDDKYRKALHQLLPPGPALPDLTATELDDFLRSLARELERTDAGIWLTWLEMDPLLTTYQIKRWEDVTGLPGCSGVSVLLEERRLAVAAQLTAVGSGSIPSLTDVAAAMGYAITITEGHTRATRSGRARCGRDRASGLATLFRYTISTGVGANDEQLMCIIEKLNPSQQTIHWDIT